MIWKKSIGYKEKESKNTENRLKVYRHRNTINFIQKNAKSVGSANISFHTETED
jgi:hypothetical protein